MMSYLLPILIDVIDASPFEEMSVLGVPAVAIAEAAIIYYTTRSKTLASIGLIESLIPGVDIVPFATLSRIVGGKKY